MKREMERYAENERDSKAEREREVQYAKRENEIERRSGTQHERER